MTSSLWLVLAGIMGLAFSLTFAVYRTLTTTSDRAKFDEALDILRSSEITELDDGQVLDADAEIKEKGWSWSRWWLLKYQQAGRQPEDPATPGRAALGLIILGSIFGVLVWPAGVGGIVLGPALAFFMSVYLGWESNKRNNAMDKQLPMLLAELRSQMHAGVTVQAALMNTADTMPSPLGDEVRSVKRDVNVSIPLDQALETLAHRVKSRQMQFLVSSINIAVRSGSDLVPQLVVIEEIVQQRARIQGKIKAAIALAKPTTVLAAGAPILMFAYMSISDPNYTSFFFGSFVGMVLFIGCAILWGFGLWIIRIMIKGVENT